MLLLPLYLEHLGANRTQIGTLMAMSAVGGLASRPFCAWSLDSWGRKPTVLLGTIVLVAGMGLLYWVHDLGPVVYGSRILLGIGAGTLFTAYFTWATDMIPSERRTEGIAIFGISGLLPIGLNAFIEDFGIDAPTLRVLFPGVGALIACSLLMILPLREPEVLSDAAGDPEDSAGGVRAVLFALSRPPLWPAWLAAAVFAGLVGVFMAFATVSAEARGAADAADLWLTYAIGAIGVRALGARLPDRLGPANLIAPALLLYACGMLLMARGTTGSAFVVAGFVAGLGHGLCFPVIVSQIVSRSPARWRGSAMAMFTAVWGLSELITAPAFGAISDHGGDALMYTSAALSAAAAHRLAPR
jgi:MFS family permease